MARIRGSVHARDPTARAAIGYRLLTITERDRELLDMHLNSSEKKAFADLVGTPGNEGRIECAMRDNEKRLARQTALRTGREPTAEEADCAATVAMLTACLRYDNMVRRFIFRARERERIRVGIEAMHIMIAVYIENKGSFEGSGSASLLPPQVDAPG